MGLAKHQKLSKSEYNSLTTKDEDTFYAVNENGDFSEENLEDSAELYIGDKKVSIKVLQETGQSTEDTMSQKAITDAITDTVNSNILPFAICTTGGSQIAKTVTTSVGHFILTTGARIAIRFNYTHTAAKMTLNVNGTGEKSVYYKGTNVGANMVYSYTVYEFVYDGTYWRITGVDTDTTYSNATQSADGLMSSNDKTKLDYMGYALAYNLTTGYLVKTSLPAANSNMVLVDIIGNTYNSSKYPIHTIVQFYDYNESSGIIQTSATYIGTPIEEIKAFRYNGYVYIWFMQVNNYTTIRVRVTNQSNSYRNYVDTITNSGVPEGATNLVTIKPTSAFVPSNTGYQRIGDQSTALGYYSMTGIRTGDTAYPYAYITNVSPLSFTIVDDTLYGVSLAKGDSTTYTYNGNNYTVTNPSSSYAASVFLVQDSDGLLVKGTSYPMNICIIAKSAVTIGNGRILSAKNITGNVWELIVNQYSNTIQSYTSPLILYLQKKTNSTNYSGGYSVASGLYSVASGAYSIASGGYSIASGNSSVASGLYSVASGNYSIARGRGSKASHLDSVILAAYGISGRDQQCVVGIYNKKDSSAYFIVGNGTSENNRSNAMTITSRGVTANTFIGDLQGNLVNTLPVSQGGTGRTIFYADTVLIGQGTDKDTGVALPIGARNIASEITDDNVDDIPNVYAVKQAIENKSVQSLNINIVEDVQIKGGANHEQYIYVNDIGNYIINAHFTVKTYNSSTYPEYNVKIKLISTNLTTLQSTILSQTQINGNWSGIVKGQDIHNISLSGIFNIQSMLTQNTKIVIENDGKGIIDIMGNNFCQINILKIS